MFADPNWMPYSFSLDQELLSIGLFPIYQIWIRHLELEIYHQLCPHLTSDNRLLFPISAFRNYPVFFGTIHIVELQGECVDFIFPYLAYYSYDVGESINFGVKCFVGLGNYLVFCLGCGTKVFSFFVEKCLIFAEYFLQSYCLFVVQSFKKFISRIFGFGMNLIIYLVRNCTTEP